MKEQLEQIRLEAKKALELCEDPKALEELRIRYLGKKGELTAILKQMGKLSAEERPVIGQLANQIRAEIENDLNEAAEHIHQHLLEKKLASETIDVTLPGTPAPTGKEHPLNIVLNEVEDIFLGMGFSIAEGPEVETDYYNFEALNLPKDHPARHPSKKNLHDIVDVAVDCKIKLGDATLSLDGFPQKIGALSTYANAYVMNCIVVEAINMLVNEGVNPPVWRSGNCPGGDEWNAQFIDRFKGDIRCL